MDLKILVISAVDFEAQATVAMLKSHGVDVEYFAFGIGPIHAAKSIPELLKKMKDRWVLYIGTAGTFGEFDAPYLATLAQAHWLPTGERMGLSKYMPSIYPPIRFPKSKFLDLPSKHVLTSSSISYDKHVALEEFSESAHMIENMEFYAIAQELLKHAGERMFVLFGITNAVGPNSSAQWFDHFKESALMSASYFEKYLMKHF